MNLNSSLTTLQTDLNVVFEDQKVLRQAFTHSSHVNEHKAVEDRDNERLEFLGDAVLELTVSEYLYDQYHHLTEGELTKLRASIVCEASLVQFAIALNLGQYVLLGKGEENTGGRTRPALLADLFEAFIGALFLDQGLDAVRSFLQIHMFPKLQTGNQATPSDYKTELQEWIQHQGLGEVTYRIVEERGPAHDREFTAEVRVEQTTWGSGVGKSKKEAEQHAAAEALSAFKQKPKA